MAKAFSKLSVSLGIDPGKSGGLVSICGGLLSITPMPVTERDLWNWFDSYQRHYIYSPFAVIEWIHPAIQGIGKAAMSKLYGNYMQLRGFLIAAGIPYEEVKPVEWQRFFSIPSRKKTETTYQWKDRLRGKAQQLFPELSIWGDSKAKQLVVCDALLIAEFCRRKHK